MQKAPLKLQVLGRILHGCPAVSEDRLAGDALADTRLMK